MKSDTYYFTHDYNARFDEKIKLLIRKHSMLGYGCYWAIIEDLYNNANALRTDYDGIAFDLRITTEQAKSIINDFGLFEFDGDYFGSKSVERRLNERNEKSLKARQSAFNRWNKVKEDANALPTQSDSNAIKESKRKKRKEKENKSSILLEKESKDILFKNEFLQKSFEEFLEMRKMKKKPMTDKAKILFKSKLEKLSNKNIDMAIKIVNQSILNCWQDIYELKQPNQKKNQDVNRSSSNPEALKEFFNQPSIETKQLS